MITELFKILALCLVAVVLCIILKQKNAEYALFITIAAGVVITVILLKNISAPIATIKIMLKMLLTAATLPTIIGVVKQRTNVSIMLGKP